MLESGPEDALVKTVETVESVETVETAVLLSHTKVKERVSISPL